ncbi:hypothetical protein GQ57_23900 [Burkholderia sp. MSh2]|uniref:DUF7661 domain-containing protein n=1 Tax=Burkholderia paludis TaxID=1506587 RepID=A0A6J5DFL0_9BURK|nr:MULTISPECIES: hypothetical protein [Burkholderia]KEZ03509.1 hypothetical protein GQ57_23900 [Burkholderia sp. MSh2]CAB3752197.1 hypothetical protein LMG30113_01687 [Burkholderia paludis]VWB48655.1 hypothetical protein BPA30113_02083 [Burkholderia paludis]
MQDEYRFNAFGRRLAVVPKNGRRAGFDLGAEGKRRPANLHVPSAFAADEPAQYLGDLLPENAPPRRGEAVPATSGRT